MLERVLLLTLLFFFYHSRHFVTFVYPISPTVEIRAKYTRGRS